MALTKTIKSLYTRRQAGIKTTLRITGVRITIANAGVASILLDFGMLGFDRVHEPDEIKGLEMLVSTTPPPSETTIKFSSLRKLERDVMLAAWRLGAADLSRYTGKSISVAEWFFKPSWNSGPYQNRRYKGMSLPDDRINENGERAGDPDLFPARIIPNDELEADNQQHIYKFCDSKLLWEHP